MNTKVVREVSPIPKGRYWITITDVPEGQIADFDKWLSDSRGSVKVESSSLLQDSDPPAQFIIFNVVGPGAFLNAVMFGFPNTAPSEITSIKDVEQSPVIETPGIPEFLSGVKGAGKLAAFLLIGVLLFKVVKK